jgi:hypothetical protein
MDAHGKESPMSYVEDSHARTSLAPDRELVSLGLGAGSGRKWRESSAKFDRASRSWKTAQSSLLVGLDEFSETWPKWGLMRSGESWELRTAALRTRENGYGFLPTPNARDWKDSGRTERLAATLEMGFQASLPRVLAALLGLKQTPMFSEWMMGWPIGWSDLKPLEMDRFQQWLDSHGIYSEVADTQPTLAACARGSKSETAQADNAPVSRRTKND